MNIVVGSAHRNNVSALPRYFAQVAALRDMVSPNTVRVIAVEGDSTDNTRELIHNLGVHHFLDTDLITCNHGQRHFGSTEDPERMAALSQVGNAILAGVRSNDDILVYVESDLIWEPKTIYALAAFILDDLHPFDILSPLIMAGDLFYDVWAVRKNGSRFAPYYPYHRDLSHELGVITEVDSTGSCMVMRGSTAISSPRMSDGALVEWGHLARWAGYKIGVCPWLKVFHP